jgi:signal transduction histidine kinase
LSNHADFRNVDIQRISGSDKILKVYGNEQELGQVVINLMINACHAVKGSGQIEIETLKTDQNQVFIKVRDNGMGIRKKDITKIFDPFFTTKPLGQGTGLGLSVGYGIIKRHGGKITVRNRSRRGAEFSIKLPAYSDENPT